MADATGSNVTINFDGLLSFALDRENKLCKIAIHTATEDHIMKIIVKPENGQSIRKVLSPDKLKELKSLHLFISDKEGNQLPPSASDGGSFDRILDLASGHFYKRKRAVQDGKYDCAIWLQNGAVSAGDLDTCSRVKQAIFQNLKFEWECKQEWEGFKRGVQTIDPEAIIDFPLTFARNATATIALGAGQSLQMTSPKSKDPIFGPLFSGSNYDIKIEYSDAIPPTGLFDCGGFAHHCEALVPADDPIFGIFRPAKFKDEDNALLSTVTEPGCCEICRNGSSGDLRDEFQQSWGNGAQPASIKSKSKTKK